jgi:gliding motility-associated protein GldC
MKKSEIKFTVSTDEQKLPTNIEWSASDTEADGTHSCKAILLAIWDGQAQNTLKIDLWTNEMLVDEMKLFYYQTLLSMAGTLERAIGEDKMAGDMRDFCAYFAKKMNLDVTPPSL